MDQHRAQARAGEAGESQAGLLQGSRQKTALWGEADQAIWDTRVQKQLCLGPMEGDCGEQDTMDTGEAGSMNHAGVFRPGRMQQNGILGSEMSSQENEGSEQAGSERPAGGREFSITAWEQQTSWGLRVWDSWICHF